MKLFLKIFFFQSLDDPTPGDGPTSETSSEINSSHNITENAIQKYNSFPDLDDLLNSSYNNSTNSDLDEIFDFPLETPGVSNVTPPTEQVD